MGILDVQIQETDKQHTLTDMQPNTSEKDINIAASIAGLVNARLNTAKTARLTHEETWMRAWRNFRGRYGPEVRFTETEKSTIFIKISKSKAVAAINQVLDNLFASGKFPISVEPTPVPEGVAKTVSIQPGDGEDQDGPAESPYGYDGDDKDFGPGVTLQDLLGPGGAKKLEDKGLKITPGTAVGEAVVTLSPADIAAHKMNLTLQDQLLETDAKSHVSSLAFEMAVFGTGALEGPFTTRSVYHKWEKSSKEAQNYNYTPRDKLSPRLDYASIWSLYPDPEATLATDCEYVCRVHQMTPQKLRSLKNRSGFRPKVVEFILENFNPDYTPEWFERELKDSGTETASTRYRVIEYWGTLDTKIANEFGIDIPESMLKHKSIQVNAWVCCNQVLRLILNPFTPARLPYLFVPYERHPYQIWGVGVVENMEDSQMVMNGHVRMAIDNLALSGNAVFELDETYLVNSEDTRFFPGRIFRKMGAPPGAKAIDSVKFQNTTQENLMMFDKFRQLADESTGIQSYSHGQLGVSGMTRTSSGMSMLMGASALNIKGVLSNIDTFLLEPLGNALFAWNMQFNPDVEIEGDLSVKALGVTSMMNKEVRSQRLLMLMQVGANPLWAPFINGEYVIKQLVKDLDLDPDKATNDIQSAKLQALIIRAYGNASGQAAPDGPQPSEDAVLGQGGGEGAGDSPRSLPQPGPKGAESGTLAPRTSPLPGEA